jgi:hypothetical protein
MDEVKYPVLMNKIVLLIERNHYTIKVDSQLNKT